jgi:hypothetical protein
MKGEPKSSQTMAGEKLWGKQELRMLIRIGDSASPKFGRDVKPHAMSII